MQPVHRKIALACLSTAVTTAVALPLVLRRITPDPSRRGTVHLVDTEADLTELLDRNATSDVAVARADPSVDTPPPTLRPLDEDVAREFFPSIASGGCQFHPQTYAARKPNTVDRRSWPEHPRGWFWYRKNDMGMSEDGDVRTDHVPLRVLVTGDSHVEGVVPNEESLANVLEDLLGDGRPAGAVDVLNAGVGGFNVYNYLGTLERFADLEPDVFLVVVYGGNDFYDSTKLRRYFDRLPAWTKRSRLRGERRAASERAGTIHAQELGQARYFASNPDDVDLAVDTMNAVLREIDRRCAARSIDLIVAYLPPPLRVQPEVYAEALEASRIVLGPDADALSASDRIADRVLAFLEARGIEHLDLRPRFRATEAPLYWFADHHINTLGHRVAAEELHPLLEPRASEAAAGLPSRRVIEFDVPVEQGPTWTTVAGNLRFVPLEDRRVVVFSSASGPASLSVDLGTPMPERLRVRLDVMADRAFTLRVGVDGRWSAPLDGKSTRRELTSIFVDVPALDGDAGGASTLTIEIESATPVVLGALSVAI